MLGKSEDNLIDYLHDEISKLKEFLSNALVVPSSEIYISFPSLSQFHLSNNIHKSSWAIYTKPSLDNPKLLYTGNFLIQGNNFGNRSQKSVFGHTSLSSLSSLACTYSTQASFFKMNWTLDLDIFQNDDSKLKITRSDYQMFLSFLNNIRAHWLLHLSEEAKVDFVIAEFSEPSDSFFFLDLDSIDSTATRIKTYFKPISESAIAVFKGLSVDTEFEGRFLNIQPGTWIRDDVLAGMERISNPDLYVDSKVIDSPFKVNSKLSV